MFVKRFSEKIPDFFHYLETNRHFSGLFLCQHLEHDLTPERLLLRDRFRGYWLPIRFCFCFPQFLMLSPPRFPSWHTHYSTLWVICQEVFQSFFSVTRTQSASLTRGLSLPLDMIIIPHPEVKCNRQKAQNRDFYNRNFCVKFLLTNCVGCGIMVNSAGLNRARPAKKARILLLALYQFHRFFEQDFNSRLGFIR